MVTMRAGVIGHPIGHSLSPKLHGRWIEAYGLDAEYTAIDGESPDRFRQIVHQLRAEGWLGLNVTIPFKGDALALADHVSDTARQIGAANLLVFREDGIHADNTDAYGFAQSLQQVGCPSPGFKARVLGAGGAAPAIVVALRDLGAGRIEIANRSRDRADALAARFDPAVVIDWAARSEGLDDINVLVNATSLGMKGQPALEIDIHALPDAARVIDIVTTPLETALLRAAHDKGLSAVGGVPMLVHQAVPSFAAWFGHRPEDSAEAIAFLERSITPSA